MINLQGIQPEVAEFIRLQAKFNAEDIAVVVKRANVTPAPTAAVWSYNVPFELQSAAGETLPYTGTIAATVANTSSAGTAAVSTATPAVVLGVGSVTISGDAAAWLNTETATLTLTYTTAYGNDKTDTFVVTFTTP
jgi:hypothetical protein